MSNPAQLQETEAKSAPFTEGNKTFCEHYFLFFSLVKKNTGKKAGKSYLTTTTVLWGH